MNLDIKSLQKINFKFFLIIGFIVLNFYSSAQDSTRISIGVDTSDNQLYRMIIKDQDFFIKRDSSLSRPYMMKAICRQRMNDLEGAVNDFKTAIKLEKDSHFIANMYSWVGGAEDRLGNFEEAKRYFTFAINVNEKYTYGTKEILIREIDMPIDFGWQYYNRGIINNRLKNFGAAKNDFYESIELKPNWAEPYFGLGIAFENEGDLDKAIEYYEKAIKMNENFFRAYNNIGGIYNKKKEYAQALKWLNKAIKLSSNYHYPWLSLAETKFEMGDKIGACMAIKKYLEFFEGKLNDEMKELEIKYCGQ